MLLTACGSDSDDSSSESDGASSGSNGSSPEECKSEKSKGGSNGSKKPKPAGDPEDPVTLKFGETVRAEVAYGFTGEIVDITVSEPTASTGKIRESTGPGTPCMVKMTVVGVEDETDLNHTDFEARSSDREKFEYAYVDNNLEDETIPENQKLDTAVSFLVPDDKKIATIDLKNSTNDVFATWSY